MLDGECSSSCLTVKVYYSLFIQVDSFLEHSITTTSTDAAALSLAVKYLWIQGTICT